MCAFHIMYATEHGHRMDIFNTALRPSGARIASPAVGPHEGPPRLRAVIGWKMALGEWKS